MAALSKTSIRFFRQPQGLPRRALAWLSAAREHSRQRRALSDLSDDLLKDIGLTRRDVAAETAKPFWQL